MEICRRQISSWSDGYVYGNGPSRSGSGQNTKDLCSGKAETAASKKFAEYFGEFFKGAGTIIVEKRDATIKLRLSESEFGQIQDRMREFGTTNMSAFIRKMAIDGYIVKLELPELKEMTRLLSSYSNNLNQIAKRVNSSGRIYAADLEEIRQNQERIWRSAEKIIRELSKIQ